MAVPSIIAGINQTVMMALGIVVIATLVGAAGLGQEIMQTVRMLSPGRGLVVGMAVVSCVGVARMIKADFVKPGATVIDVGVSRIDNKIVGDVDFDAVQAVAGAITPMPGGTGPMTIGCLLENTLSAAKMLGAFPTK